MADELWVAEWWRPGLLIGCRPQHKGQSKVNSSSAREPLASATVYRTPDHLVNTSMLMAHYGKQHNNALGSVDARTCAAGAVPGRKELTL